MKNHVRTYVDEGHDVVTTEQFQEALLSHGGVPGARIALLTRLIPFVTNLTLSCQASVKWTILSSPVRGWKPGGHTKLVKETYFRGQNSKVKNATNQICFQYSNFNCSQLISALTLSFFSRRGDCVVFGNMDQSVRLVILTWTVTSHQASLLHLHKLPSVLSLCGKE